MISPNRLTVEHTVLILLAAGRSQRYGDIGSKLDADFLGKPLGLHVAVALESVPFMARLAIIDGAKLDYGPYGFETIHNDDPGEGMSRSVRIGVQRARELGADAVLIALADMPRVTAAHILRMMDSASGEDAVVASSDGSETKPPALFGKGRFDYLLSLTGEKGAADMVKAGRHVVTNPAELIDVDTADDLERLRALVHDARAHTIIHDAATRDGARRSD